MNSNASRLMTRRSAMIIGSSLVLMTMIVLSLLYWLPRDVEVSVDGVYYQLGEANQETVDSKPIEVKGKLYRDWLGARTFVGRISVDQTQVPIPESQRDLEIKFSNLGMGIIVDQEVYNGGSKLHTYGTLFINDDFSEMAILIKDEDEATEGTWNSNNGYMLSAPASTREEALNVANTLMKDFLGASKRLR